jgi:hypothetical protein
MKPTCESWRMVWEMQVETGQALWSRLVLYWPGMRAKRVRQREADRDRMLHMIRSWDGVFSLPLDSPAPDA